MKRRILTFLLLLLAIPTWMVIAQNDASPTLEITGANASDLPTITITANILDSSNRPAENLTPENFTLGGDLEGLATIVSVENVTTDELAFGSVLVIDVSTSMSGPPIAYAKEAARIFVETVGENDPVAIVVFSNRAVLVQDFTTDKDTLLSVIDNLSIGGQTALYDAAVKGSEIADLSPVPRRAVVLLSDGAEYGGRSRSGRGDGLSAALTDGVPVYTIGLGFGTDRSYLEELSSGTNARNYESPTPEELVGIYSELATLFRTQYILTLSSDIPGDGTEYEFTLQATTDEGASNVDTGTVRAPIPVPIVSFPEDALSGLIDAPVTVEPIIAADDLLNEVVASIDGVEVEIIDGQITIDPVNFPPGTYTLTVTATDVDGDTGSADASFEVAALPSEVTVNWEAGDDPITEPQEITLDVAGQTAPTYANYVVAGAGMAQVNGPITDAENGFPFTLDPFEYPAGDFIFRIEVANQGGATASIENDISIGNVAPRDVTVSGIESSQEIAEATTITVDAATQPETTIETVSISIPEQNVTLDSLTINPAALQPGDATLEITVTDNNGLTATTSVPVSIAALPPQVNLGDLPETISGNTNLGLTIESQTGISGVTYSIDGGEEIELDGTDVPIDAHALGDGEHTLTITVTNEAGESSTTETTFTVALPTPTPNLAATADAQNTADAQAAIDAQSTVDAQSTADILAVTSEFEAEQAATANAEATTNVLSETQQADVERQGTIDANATRVLMDDDERSTAEAQDVINAQNTADAAATSDAQATLDAQATTEADASVQVTDEVEASEQASDEPTATEDVTGVPSEDVTEVPSEDASVSETEEPSDEPTIEASSTPTLDATLTPVEITEVGAQDAPAEEGSNTGLFLIVCGVLGVFVLIAIILFGRRRGNN